mmetsp:Transcript_59674/g.159691  ORF Transcript_59674/g.159691 Transcript_59674/m.159691 type:complete len:140 (+) Transcript_59674:105-524(+)
MKQRTLILRTLSCVRWFWSFLLQPTICARLLARSCRGIDAASAFFASLRPRVLCTVRMRVRDGPDSSCCACPEARKFLLHLQEEKIRSCVVVSHSGFLRHLFLKHLRYEAEDVDFENAELRSVVLVFPSATNDLRPALG